MWLLILKLELLVGARYPHRIYVSAYRSHELLSECLCLIFFFDIREDEVQEYEYNCRVVYIDSTRLKGKDIILAKEPENLYRPPSKPIVECDWTLEMNFYHSDS